MTSAGSPGWNTWYDTQNYSVAGRFGASGKQTCNRLL